jgi:DNA-directed RNA polymerase subunit beta'
MVEQEKSEVWDILDDVIKEHPVILNRAPTLHRLGMQSFEAILIEGKAIQLHPLVCSAFNADFDGDQMAVHIPLSIEAQIEARVLMMSTNNILSPASGKPVIIPSQDIVLGCYYMTRIKPFSKGEGMIFANPEEARMAYDAEEISHYATIKCRINKKMTKTTIGRILLYEIIPKVIPFSDINKVLGKKELANLIDKCYRLSNQKETVILADELKTFGYTEATKSGISISLEDMVIPKNKKKIIEQSQKEVEEIREHYVEGLITEGERYNKVIDIWSKAAEKISKEMMESISQEKIIPINGNKEATPSFNSLYVMADSGARGSSQQIKQLAGMRGLMAKPSGEIIETPIVANFREGLSALQYFISTHGARKGLADTALKTANSGYLTRRLVDVAQDSIITEVNCNTLNGIEITPLLEGNEIIQNIGDRILGRIALDDIMDTVTGNIIVKSGSEINEKKIKIIENAGISNANIRSALTCQTINGICCYCYGRDLSRGHIVNIGDAIGVIAAQSIGEPGTQLTMRTFHAGGIASGSIQQSSYECKGKGRILFENIKTARNRNKNLIVMNRKGSIKIIDESGREKENYPAVYGSIITIENNSTVSAATTLIEWDPFALPILTEISGTVHYKDLIEGISFAELVDEDTGISHKTVIENKDNSIKPKIIVKNKPKNISEIKDSLEIAQYLLPVGAIINVSNEEKVKPGDLLAKINREAARTKDITGGLPRVVELFEARKPKDFAIISEISGTIVYGKDTKGKRKIIVNPEFGKQREYLLPKGKHVVVREGDYIRAGEALMDGSINPHDILRVLGEKALSRYMIEEIQEVYRMQGVKINDKHVEIIVRQMLKRVKIKDGKDTIFLANQQIEKHHFDKINTEAIKLGKIPAIAEPLLLGITKASLSTESFISGASFQETTKVLTDAAVSSKIDYLQGLKENVIMGKLIPAGTGLSKYRNLKMEIKDNLTIEETGLTENIPLELLENI